MNVLKKYPVAWTITALVIVGCVCYSQFVAPKATTQAATVTTTTTETGDAATTDSGVSGTSYIQDNARVLSSSTEKKLADYNQTWRNEYGTQIAVITVSSVSGDISDAAIAAANEIGLSGYDMILYLDIGGKACYFDCGDSLWDSYVSSHNILSSYPNQYLYDDYMAGNYDSGVLKLMNAMDSYFATCFQQIGTTDYDAYQGEYHTSNSGGGVMSILILVILAVIILSWIDKSRYKSWKRRYGGGVNPAVMFVPWVLWHRPGSSWWSRNFGSYGQRPPSPGGYSSAPRPPRPPGSSSSRRPPSSGFGSNSFWNGFFRGGRGGGFGGGFGGGHGGGFGGGGHGGGFGGGHR